VIFGLREILAPALAAAGLDATGDTWRISEAWPQALGEGIGSRAVPLRLTRGELLVSVPDAVWRQELSLLAPEIVARLNEALGAAVVQRLKLVGATGAAAAPPPSPPRRLRVSAAGGEGVPPALAAGTEIGAALAGLWRARARRLARDREPPSQDKRRER
jgi:hypothetical protein